MANSAFVGYLPVGDADVTAIAADGVELSYNGVTLGNVGGNYNGASAFPEGPHSYWGYERIYYRASASAPVVQVADSVASFIKSTTAIIALGSLHVSRAGTLARSRRPVRSYSQNSGCAGRLAFSAPHAAPSGAVTEL